MCMTGLYLAGEGIASYKTLMEALQLPPLPPLGCQI